MSLRYIGRGVTGANGVATLTEDENGNPVNGYTGVGAGEIDFVCSLDSPSEIGDGSVVSETYEVLDCVKYDTGIDGTATDIYDERNANSLLTRTNEYSTLTEVNAGTTAQLWISSIPNDCVIDLELCQADGSQNDQNVSIYQNTTYKTVLNLGNMGFTSSVIGTWRKIRIDLRTEGYVTITDLEDPTKTFTNTTAFSGQANRIGFLTSNNTTEIRLRDVKVYPL